MISVVKNRKEVDESSLGKSYAKGNLDFGMINSTDGKPLIMKTYI